MYLDSDRETYDTIIRHLKAFPVALKQHLRGEFEMGEFAGGCPPVKNAVGNPPRSHGLCPLLPPAARDEVAGTLATAELNALSTADNLPLSVCTSLSMGINSIKLNTEQVRDATSPHLPL